MQTTRLWLTTVFIITIITSFAYLAIQQSYRQGGNDPQIQLAEDWAASLSAGATSENINSGSKVEITSSLAPFLMVFDASGAMDASSALLHGQAPTLPAGVLDSAKKTGETRITWQPETGARFAVVIKYYKSNLAEGYMVAGRSLREVEVREQQLLYTAAAAWFVSVVGSFALLYLGNKKQSI